MRLKKLWRISADKEQLVIPVAFSDNVLYLAHIVLCSDHLCQEKNEQRILNMFYWPGFYKVFSTLPTDYLLQERKASLVSLPIINIPFNHIAMDDVGQIKRSRAGHHYYLVI